jgi:hypothetical protein
MQPWGEDAAVARLVPGEQIRVNRNGGGNP